MAASIDERVALRYYLSPFDTVLDIVRNPQECVGKDQSISVRPVDAFHLGAVTAPDGQPAIGCVHVAWRARSGAVLMHPNGLPDAVLSTVPELESDRAVLELPRALASMADEIHERAGLYAWRETARSFTTRQGSELWALAEQAWRNVPLTISDGPDPDFNEFALYDPEFGQWHFVKS